MLTYLLLAGFLSASQDLTPSAALAAFDEALDLSDEDGGALWGRELFGPLIFLDPASRTMIASEPDAEGRLTERDGAFVGPLGDDVGVANTAQSWGGVTWTTMVWPLPSDATDRRRLIAHELFHGLQPALGHSIAAATNTHLDTLDGRIWLRVEFRALAAALRSTSVEGRRSALRDAHLFRAYRRSLFEGSSANEDALERNEGLAEYTGWRLCGLVLTDLPEQVASRLERDEPGKSFQRSFAYASGPAYAVLVDLVEGTVQCEVARPVVVLAEQIAQASLSFDCTRNCIHAIFAECHRSW